MKRWNKVSVLLSVLVVSAIVYATPKSWVSTRYRPDIWSSGSWYRSPVTNGYLDVRLFVENATFTNAEFSINYDSGIVAQIGSGNILELITGLTVEAVTTENLDGAWKKTTITLSGNVTLGDIQYESESIFRLRLIPVAEGTVPITLWPGTRYPESYYSCSLSLTDNGQEVVHERKEWNDGTQLFTFTDKTSASVIYHYDYNFGTPVNGFLRVVYADESVEEFHVSDHNRGITIDAAHGGYFITPQPNAVLHTLIFPGYENWDLSLGGGWSVSHTQPTGFLGVKEADEGFHGIRATSDDIVLTIGQPGIGVNFENAVYTAAIAGDQTGILTKTYAFEYVDSDTVRLTIAGGLAPDFNYNLYIYKDGVILGRAWFSASIYYPVTFTVKDENETPLSNALVAIPIWGMFGPSSIDELTDENGQAFFEMPGNPEWGMYHQYRVIFAGYNSVSDSLFVYDDAVEVTVVMTPAAGVNLAYFARFSTWWKMDDCAWNNDCEGADMNFDGVVDLEDLVLFAARWVKDI